MVRQAAGDRFEEIEIQCLTFVVRVVPNGRQILEETAALFAMDSGQAADVPIALVGDTHEIIDILSARRQRWAMTYWVVHEAELEAFAPVVSALAGR